MLESFGNTGILLAQGMDNTGAFASPIVMVGMILFMFYFLILRPQQQQERKRRQMIEALKKNDRVLTTGGMYATVISVDGAQDRVVLRVDDEKGTKITFTKSSVARVIEPSIEKPAGISE
jgi:preprotein translocase subunit YajC